ncbi:MAG TPA: SRPBCC family protein [Acidimicrobiales bacterium]|nr:SRPBCC family protein [Acidimicrobiales bacterium]
MAPSSSPSPSPASAHTPDAPPTAVARATFTVPPAVVWQYRLDFDNLPAYNPDVTNVRRISDGDPDGVGGVWGVGARYAFDLADPRQPGQTHPIELWPVDAVEPTLVAAGMTGASDAYEEFVVEPRDGGGCEATLSLWLTLPDGLPEEMVAAAAASSLASIEKEVRLMKENLEAATDASS